MTPEFEKQLVETIVPFYQKARSGDWDHVVRVVGLCRTLLKSEPGDEDVVIPAAYLHDIGWSAVDYSDFTKATPHKKTRAQSFERHMEQGAAIAGRVLAGLEADPDRIREIQAIIRVHDLPETVFEMNNLSATLLVEADRLDRYGKTGLERFKTMFGADKLEGPYWEEAKQLRLTGLNEWFRTQTAVALSQKLAKEMGLFESAKHHNNIGAEK